MFNFFNSSKNISCIILPQKLTKTTVKIITCNLFFRGSILKATTDLERIGENAMSIAWETIRVKGNPRIPEVEEIISSMTHDVKEVAIATSFLNGLFFSWIN